MSASPPPVQEILDTVVAQSVWAPPIKNPHKGTTWHVGSKVTVTWDTSKRPAKVTNPIGTLLLGHIEHDGKGGENLDSAHPLAKGFKLEDGHVTVTVPKVKPNHNYIVALIGSSGNISPQFTISIKK